MAQARQTFERRQLGLMLRRLREQAGKSQLEAAHVVKKARTRIGELEDGKFTITIDHLSNLLDLYGVTGEERHTALKLGTLARARPKYRTYTDLLPGSFQRLADLEMSATEIETYEFGLVPGLLQSLGYVRATIDCGDGIWWPASNREREQRIKFRLDRQDRVLDAAEPKALTFVVTENALRAGFHPDVMHDQRRHILTLLEKRQNLDVHVLPDTAVDNPARGGGIALLGFGDKGKPVGFLPSVFGPSTYYHQESDTAALSRAFRSVMDLALDRDSSARLIRRIEKES